MAYYPAPRKDQEPKVPEPSKRKAFRWIVLCVSALMVLYGGIRLIRYYADLVSVRQASQELKDIYEGPAESASPAAALSGMVSPDPVSLDAADSLPAPLISPSLFSGEPEEALQFSGRLPVVDYPGGYQLNSRIQDLRKKSEYIIGWISMDSLEEPVVRKDNSFFLNHDAFGRKNVNGAIFMDEDTNLLTRPYTILLYGHNMKTGAMFGDLHKYRDFSYCYRHRLFKFDTLYEEGRYVVFAAADISLIKGRAGYVNLSTLQSSDRGIRKKALQDLIRCSAFETVFDVNEEDQLLLLVTCTGDDDERLIVAARRLRDDESENNILPR